MFSGVLGICSASNLVSQMIFNRPTIAIVAIIIIIVIHMAGSLSDNFRLGIFFFDMLRFWDDLFSHYKCLIYLGFRTLSAKLLLW